MLDRLKNLLKNRTIQLIVAFIAGGTVATFILPEKTIIKKEVEIQYKDKIVEKEVVKWKTKVVYRDRVVEKEVKKTKSKITYPDGKIVETEVYESNSQQVERIQQMEQEKAQEKLAQVEREYQEKQRYLEEHLNPKKLSVYGGFGAILNNWGKTYELGGFNYPLWGPFLVGGEVTTHPGAAITFGFRF